MRVCASAADWNNSKKRKIDKTRLIISLALAFRIAKIKTVLNEHDRISSLLSGWSLSLFAKEADAIAEAQESERAAKEALADG